MIIGILAITMGGFDLTDVQSKYLMALGFQHLYAIY